MNCEQVKELLLTDHIDGELSSGAAEELGNHLEGCPACRAYQTSVREAALAPFARLTPRKPAPDLWQRILTAIRAESPVIREPLPAAPGGWRSAFQQLKLLFKLVPAMALAGLLLVLGTLWQGKPLPTVPPTLLAMQRHLTPEELLFGTNPAMEVRILRGMRLDTPMEKLFL